jgi:hypothetical protein
MQHTSANKPIRGLPALWGGYLLGFLETDRTGLNRSLVMKPDGHPFELLVHPAPYPVKGVPKTFDKILDGGHWPDSTSYDEWTLDGTKFNLFRRVAEHLPGSQDWLFAELRRPALELAHDERAVQSAIEQALRRFGLARVHSAASLLIVNVLLSSKSGEQYVDALFRPTWSRLAASGEALHVTLLTLLWQEALSQRAVGTAHELKAFCYKGWINLLRRPELRHSRPLLRAGIDAVRNMLIHIDHAPIIAPAKFPTAEAQICLTICPVWKPSPAGRKAEKRLTSFFYKTIEAQLCKGNWGPLQGKAEAAPLPNSITDALRTVLAGVREADSCWSTWDRAYVGPPESTRKSK